MDEKTHAAVMFRWGLIYHLDVQASMLREQRERLEKEIRELEATATIPAIIDRVILENADALNKLSKV